MNKHKAVLFYDRCRLCLDNPGTDDIFTKTNLPQDIFLCTGIKVASDDNLPRKICIQCLSIVIKAKQLRILAVANDTHLKSLFDDDELFIIQITDTDQAQDENIDNKASRRSSTDSDRTVVLQTVEPSNSDQDNTGNLNKGQSSDSSDHGNCLKKKISVRKDLFNCTGAVSSSTKDTTNEPYSGMKIKIFKSEDGDSDMSYVCKVCQKKFSVWKKYYLHQKTHNRNIVCPLDACEKKFATKGDLKKHIRTHTGERPFQCDVCDKRFSQRVTLKMHKLNVHAV